MSVFPDEKYGKIWVLFNITYRKDGTSSQGLLAAYDSYKKAKKSLDEAPQRDDVKYHLDCLPFYTETP